MYPNLRDDPLRTRLHPGCADSYQPMTSSRFHEIDMLRGVACAAVVAYHYLYRGQSAGWISTHVHSTIESVARYGYLGVHLFFVISGFVIFMSAQNTSLRGFAASRVARLYPALWVAAPLTATFIWTLGSHPFNVELSQLGVNMTMLAHWFNVDFVDGAYWSLAVELQFYLLVSIVIALKLIERAEWLVGAWLAVAAVNAVRPIFPVEFWLAAKWAPLFSAGICFSLLRTQGWSRRRLILIAVSYVLAVSYEIGPSLLGSRIDLVSACVGAGAITAFYAVFFCIAAGIPRFKASPLFIWAGLLTYPVYLLHQNIGYILVEALAPFEMAIGFRLLVAVAVVVALAWLIVIVVERPIAPRLRQLISPSGREGPNADKTRNVPSH